MPNLIEHIDAIARQKQRDVLFVTFSNEGNDRVDVDNLPVRDQLIAWLDAHAIGWRACGDIADLTTMRPYQGQIYLDVPFDESDPTYQEVRNHLEHADGTMVFPEVQFWALQLPYAMKNSHHDAPGFWENWAENF